MAINFNTSFTGKNTGIELPSSQGVQRAQEGLSQMVLDAEKLRYSVYERNRNEFLKNANIDPVFVLSDSARKYTQQRINDFNKTWGKRAQETNYNFSDEDRLNMQTHKNLIMAEQQDQLQQYELFKQHRDLVAKNPNRYDTEKFALSADEYMKTGRYDQTMPMLRSIPFGSFIREQASKVKGEYNAVQTVRGNQVAIATKNIQDIPKFIEQNLFVNDQATMGMLEDWDKEPDKSKWLIDADHNNKIDPTEQKNGIVEWAKQFYAKDADVTSYSPWKSVKGTGTKATSEPVEVAGAQVKIFPGKRATNRTYGDQTYSDKSFGFGGNTMLYGIPTKGGKTLEGDYEDVEKGSINGRLVLYDPIKHVFVMEVGAGSESADLKSRVLLEIPESNIQDYQNIPLQLEDGSNITVDAYRKPSAETMATPTVVKKKTLY
jgi:hypothetical protein